MHHDPRIVAFQNTHIGKLATLVRHWFVATVYVPRFQKFIIVPNAVFRNPMWNITCAAPKSEFMGIIVKIDDNIRLI